MIQINLSLKNKFSVPKILGIILIAIFSISIIVYFKQSEFLNPYELNNVNHSLSSSEDTYSKGRSLNIIEHASINTAFYPDSLPINISYPLVDEWTADSIGLTYSDLNYKKQYLQNSYFNQQYVQAPWIFITSNYVSFENEAWTSPGYLEMDVQNPYSYSDSDYAYFEQNVSVDEELSSSKLISLSFDYYYENHYKHYDEITIYMAVIIDGIEVNYTIDSTSIPRYEWTTMTLAYNPELAGQETPNDVTARVGVDINGSLTVDSLQELKIDNIELTIWTNPNESELLIAKDIDSGLNYSFSNSSAGNGFVDIDVEKSSDDTDLVKFTIMNNISDVLDFELGNITLQSELNKPINSTYLNVPGSSYLHDEYITWKTDFMVDYPYNYDAGNIEILKPDHWNITSIFDGYYINHVLDCSGTTIGNNLSIIPSEFVTNGFWSITAESQNKVDVASCYHWVDSVRTSTSELLVGDDFELSVSLNNSVATENTVLSCSIFHPNDTLLWEGAQEPSSLTTTFGNFTVGLNMSIGTYTAHFEWINNLTSEYIDDVGVYDLEFYVIHEINLSAIESHYSAVLGDPVLIKAKFLDLQTNNSVSFASLLFNITDDQFYNMTYIGSGTYIAEVDTSILDCGNNFVSITASQQFYCNITKNNLISIEIVQEELRIDASRDITTVDANSYACFEFNITGESSNNPIYPLNISCDWVEEYTTYDYNNGSYRLNVSTFEVTDGNVPETFTINVYINKTDYSPINDILLLKVIPIPAQINMNASFVEINKGELFFLKVNFTEVADGSLIGGSECAVTWSDSIFLITIGNEFYIRGNTSNLDIDLHPLYIELSHPGYETRLKAIYVMVLPIESELIINNAGSLEFTCGDVYNITCRYLAQNVDYCDGSIELLGDIEGDFKWNGNFYYFEINTSDLLPKSYFAQVVATGENMESQIKEFIFSVIPVELEINISSNIIHYDENNNNLIEFYIYDVNHQSLAENFPVYYIFNDIEYEIAPLVDGTYNFNLDELDLKPSSTPYQITIQVENPYGDNLEIILSISRPRDDSLTIIIALSSLVGILMIVSVVMAYRKYYQQTKFQRLIRVFEKKITAKKLVDRSLDITRNQMISRILEENIRI